MKLEEEIYMSKKKNDNSNHCKGEVIETLPNAYFKVKILDQAEEHIVIASISGNIRRNYIKIIKGDTVVVKLCVYDLNKGQIIFRGKNSKLV